MRRLSNTITCVERSAAIASTVLLVLISGLSLPASADATVPPLQTDQSEPAVHETESAAPSPGKLDALSALQEGNRLFEAGDLAGAVSTYRLGYDPRQPNLTLTYNLATALHHSERLPEAILWYRRAMSDDPWVEENLWLARKSLGSQRLPLTGFRGWLVTHGPRAADALVAWVWLACLGAVVLPGNRLRPAVAAAGMGTLLYLALAVAATRTPKAVVFLEDCETGSVELPAGTEAWAVRTQQGWEIASAENAVCPESSLGLVNP